MSTLDFRNLPGDRLATTDHEGGRLWIIPARVRGKWKNRKTFFHIILLLIFTLTPWLRWQGQPLILMDIVDRRFVFFGKTFLAHDAPYIFFILGFLGMALISVTAIWGRVWCGWACPQTVFIEQVFRRIERLVVGNRAEQIKCSKDPTKPKHLFKLLLKWFSFIIVSLFLAHTFTAYFVSWEKLLAMMSQPPGQSWPAFVTVMFIASLVLFDFAWFREQFCIIMCPYGRFQSVLMDKDSLTVTYDYKRGEPRARNIKAKAESSAGDCIDCYKCVSVCPTGIDIRQGQQMECVACTACIDACDEVMAKIKRPSGLIRYASWNQIESGHKKVMKPRIWIYFAFIVLLGVGAYASFSRHQEFYYSVLRQNLKPYSVTMDGAEEVVINNFRVHLKNPLREAVLVNIELVDNADVTMAPGKISLNLEGNEDRHLPFFLKFSKNFWKSDRVKTVDLKIVYTDGTEKELLETLTLVGP